MNNDKLEIRIYNDPVLREKARPVAVVTPRHVEIARQMAEMMYGSRGVGLAANQVGLTERIIVVDVEWHKREEDNTNPGRQPIFMVNPEVTEESDTDDVASEGCLSLPGIEGDVWRPASIRYRYTDLEGRPVEAAAEGLKARCIQHEIDHLNGVLFIDRMEPAERKKLAGQLAKLRQSGPVRV
ncbi:MAG: peptide deformylase [bacterium]|nr:peptide deformylase [bacterium]